jgi:hypothetical protein
MYIFLCKYRQLLTGEQLFNTLIINHLNSAGRKEGEK